MAARQLRLDAEDTSCTTRAVFLERNAAHLSPQVDLEEYLHSPGKPPLPKLRGLPAPEPIPAVVPEATVPVPAPTFARSRRPFVDVRKRAANDHDDD